MNPPEHLFDIDAAEREARLNVEALAQALGGTVRAARTLLARGAAVDLSGLDRLIGLLSARALDLRPDLARSLEPCLLELLDELDALLAAVHAGELH